ncbi:fasciclin domain-containing protein [Roseomonas sp. NAR14]|uniref:Fasciclin domain-containing protein n=1 Tax=Roseomonas acroporae TaxID=2937791 RepID=A0A9X1YAH3_9PROT|nr:fasciclin domain-containing protein [Roseomonas acroporae]MCK8785102.1 fasciclin domain-containing protein [Roseomonas acroporae]
MAITHRQKLHLMLAGAALLGVAGIGTPAQAQIRNVIDTLAADGRFDRFIEIVQRAGFTDQLRGVGPITLLAPTNTAFNTAPSGVISAMMEQGSGGVGGGSLSGGSPDQIRLRAFVQYFMVPAVMPVGEGTTRVRTLNGADIAVTRMGEVVTVVNPAPGQQVSGFSAAGINATAPATVVQTIPASNGVVAVIDRVIFP